jgi:cysteinyl-tRNA synthetase
MAIRFWNTLTKKKGVFKPLKGRTVMMYNCGPTVYDYAHIGNFKSYMLAELLRRFLEWKGFRVKQVMNITDVGHMTEDDVADSRGEDKIEKAAKREHKTPKQISDFYTKAFLKDWKRLNMLEPTARPRATDFVKEMIGMNKELINKGYAYVGKDGSVYYEVGKFKRYGKLSGNTIEQLKAGAGGRVEMQEGKKNPLDFALWINNPKHIMQWKSPWGRGYPGWHIECSAMSMKLLGKTIDIHTGGEDNIFPHHECEIAQSEGATGKKFSRFWMHVRHMMVDGKKMSKSKSNFFTLEDLVKKGHDPLAVRYALLAAHYRTKMNLTEESIEDAQKCIDRLRCFTRDMKAHKSPGKRHESSGEAGKIIKKARKGFDEALSDDLNMPEALASVFGMVREINRLSDAGKLSKAEARKAYEQIIDFDRVLGLKVDLPKDRCPADIRKLIERREALRKEKKFREADRLRDRIKKKGWLVEDSPEGPKVKRA